MPGPAKKRVSPVERLSPPASDAKLARTLDRFLGEVDVAGAIAADPVSLVRVYSEDADQEVAGLLVAGLAYGRAASIRAKAGDALARLGTPAQAVDRGDVSGLDGFVYRFQRGQDLPRFARAIGRLRKAHGSLAGAFLQGVRPEDEDYAPALDRFSLALRAAIDGPLTPGLEFLIPRVDGGAGKRLCLYLRWMIRTGEADLGTWPRLFPGRFEPGRLVIPLDTHIQRIGRYVGLTDRRTGTLETARAITASLRRLSPDDPLVYDLALCHLGISGRCPRRRDVEACRACPIRAICRLGPTPKGWSGG